MEENKLYPCTECGRRVKIRSKGKCPLCRSKDIKSISKVSEKQKIKNKIKSDVRSVYFDFHIQRCRISEESGNVIHNPNRSNICHLFAKSNHPSLQSNLDNFVYLTSEEHSEFDTYLFRHEFEKLERNFEKSWQISCQRIKKLLPLCEEKTKFYFAITDYLTTNNK